MLGNWARIWARQEAVPFRARGCFDGPSRYAKDRVRLFLGQVGWIIPTGYMKNAKAGSFATALLSDLVSILRAAQLCQG